MTQTAKISITTLLIAILLAMFGNGMIMIHPANASTMNHVNPMESSQNTLCDATGCMQTHSACETYCISIPIKESTIATTVTQNLFISLDVVDPNLAIPVREPKQKTKTQNLKPKPTLRHLQTVMKKE